MSVFTVHQFFLTVLRNEKLITSFSRTVWPALWTCSSGGFNDIHFICYNFFIMARFRQQLYCIIFFLITHYSMVAEAAPGENGTEVGELLKLENLNASTNVGPESTSSATVVLDPNSTGKMRRSRSTDLRDGPSILSSPPCNVTVLIPVDENEGDWSFIRTIFLEKNVNCLPVLHLQFCQQTNLTVSFSMLLPHLGRCRNLVVYDAPDCLPTVHLLHLCGSSDESGEEGA